MVFLSCALCRRMHACTCKQQLRLAAIPHLATKRQDAAAVGAGKDSASRASHTKLIAHLPLLQRLQVVPPNTAQIWQCRGAVARPQRPPVLQQLAFAMLCFRPSLTAAKRAALTSALPAAASTAGWPRRHAGAARHSMPRASVVRAKLQPITGAALPPADCMTAAACLRHMRHACTSSSREPSSSRLHRQEKRGRRAGVVVLCWAERQGGRHRGRHVACPCTTARAGHKPTHFSTNHSPLAVPTIKLRAANCAGWRATRCTKKNNAPNSHCRRQSGDAGPGLLGVHNEGCQAGTPTCLPYDSAPPAPSRHASSTSAAARV